MLWDRLGPGDSVLTAAISHITQEMNWDVERQNRPVTWLDVHPDHCNGVRAPPRPLTLDTARKQQLQQAATVLRPCRREGKPLSREASGKIALDLPKYQVFALCLSISIQRRRLTTKE